MFVSEAIQNRLTRKRFAERKPCFMMIPGGIWEPSEVAEARKRVAAKLFIARNSTMSRVELRDLPTSLLVILAQSVKSLIH